MSISFNWFWAPLAYIHENYPASYLGFLTISWGRDK